MLPNAEVMAHFLSFLDILSHGLPTSGRRIQATCKFPRYKILSRSSYGSRLIIQCCRWWSKWCNGVMVEPMSSILLRLKVVLSWPKIVARASVPRPSTSLMRRSQPKSSERLAAVAPTKYTAPTSCCAEVYSPISILFFLAATDHHNRVPK